MSQINPTNICSNCGTERRLRLNRKKGETVFRPCLPCHRIWKANYKINGVLPKPDPTVCTICGSGKIPGKSCAACKRKQWVKHYVKSTRENHFDYLKRVLSGLDIDPARHWSTYPCLIWQFGKDKDGYGKLRVTGKDVRAHRTAFEIQAGISLSESLRACHHCDCPSCFHPAHIFAGTDYDNVRDRVDKGRSHYVPARGERSGHSKLTVEKVLQIREMARQGVTYAELARRFGVSPPTPSAVCRRRSWQHVLDVLEAEKT